ncbi:hypothetical protein FE257_012379 [Aspergillus nanangensis]|uniref:Uncharacterized protein n=1 Tax=Aspergillus nanangensis TaxID=2582783 RepID=A0AAD4CHK8_ASPNN|nr:hypothetical protein FE257_012379 [Aspergillus nanangensis]
MDQPASKPTTDSSKRCWDWMIVSGNCHYAKNRSMFRSYRRAPGKIAGNRVLGVGRVELQVQRAPEDTRTNTLVLQDVLHMPNAPCNGLSINKYRDANPGLDVEGDGEEHVQAVSDEDREPLWYGDDYHRMARVVLAGEPRGESYLEEESDDGEDGGTRRRRLSVSASENELDRLEKRLRDGDWGF